MPRRDYKNRQFMMYFPSQEDRERWRELAKKAGLPFCQWIYEIVEAHLSEEFNAPSGDADVLRENRQLRRELEKSEARIRELETAIFKLRNAFFAAEPRGHGSFDPHLLKILKTGRTWRNREILAELGVNQGDADSIEIVARQLQLLQDLELVRETPRGWVWCGGSQKK
jgi:hypothetical protein